MNNHTLDIGVEIPNKELDFLSDIIKSGISDNNSESTGDVYFKDEQSYSIKKMTDQELDNFFKIYGIDRRKFK